MATYTLTAGLGALSAAGGPAPLVARRYLSAGGGFNALTGGDVLLVRSWPPLDATGGALATLGGEAFLVYHALHHVVMPAPGGSLSVLGNTAQLFYRRPGPRRPTLGLHQAQITNHTVVENKID